MKGKISTGTLVLIGTVSLFLLFSFGLLAYRIMVDRTQAEWAKIILDYDEAKSTEEKLKIAKEHLSHKQTAVWILECADSFFEKRAISEALSTYQFFIDHFAGHPLEAGALLGAGECLESQGKIAEALNLYRRILEKKESSSYNTVATLRIAQLRIQKKEYAPAKELLEKFLSQNSTSPFANQAQMLLEMIPSS
ncbi:tetratricopeptide repeat protein [Candidatus Methylacidiphilum infernorum]|uniref:Tetratricopeptide repeat protein n=1 Tax=Candidatus Methylacidiphilum infernorum TaxID=511746 RepID=A0ABX7PXW7_9BACT|nr:tetratricopeptide repeat protein [Candidatus Methylacidiphilum infernorum]QSR87503.1 tetratricopeptide repeat protein [Candidatus Methylacidiphilum infernorum]